VGGELQRGVSGRERERQTGRVRGGRAAGGSEGVSDASRVVGAGGTVEAVDEIESLWLKGFNARRRKTNCDRLI